MLKIKNVSAIIDTTDVLSDINLEINPGEIHAIMGPNKSGKSLLAHIIQGNPYITQTTGSIIFKNKNITKYAAHKRSNLGIFSSFQHPPEIEGLTNLALIKALWESKSGTPFTAELEESYNSLLEAIGLNSRFGTEPVNSAIQPPNEWRKGEIIQMLMLQPDLIILDEIDMDLSLEDITCISLMVKSYLENKDKALIVITHNKTLLDQLEPDHVHILVDGEIRASGDSELYKRITEDGYPQFS
jgi:Fe-S cluster assembly ATP-binding protein